MMMTGTGERLHCQAAGGKNALLWCLSRLILEPDWIEPRYAARKGTRAAIDSASISRAIVRETLSFSEVMPDVTAASGGPIQVLALSHK